MNPLIPAPIAAKQANLCYVKMSEWIRKGFIPVEEKDGVRHLRQSTVKILSDLRMEHPSLWHRHLKAVFGKSEPVASKHPEKKNPPNELAQRYPDKDQWTRPPMQTNQTGDPILPASRKVEA